MADLNALLLFASVVEAQTFSEAARRLKTPVSTLSRRIADLEEQLGVRLLERTTRRLQLTSVGCEILQHALRGSEVSDAVEAIVSSHQSEVRGTLRLAAPPNLSDTLLAPLLNRFQTLHPGVSVHALVTERSVDPLAEAIDLSFRVDPPAPPTPDAVVLLSYRHQLLASPGYLSGHTAPQHPRDLLKHPLLAFARSKGRFAWKFVQRETREEYTLTFEPFLAMNDYAGLAAALSAGVGVGDLPPLVRPQLLAKGRLVEVMPEWHFRVFDLTLVQTSTRYVTRPVRLFKDIAVQMAPQLFPTLPL